jgi:large subunit ribosomal protein L4
MAQLTVYDRSGKQVGTYDIEPAEIAPRISKQLLHDAVVMYQANLRQGSHRTKSRGEVVGSTKKMYRQKGTGNARAGSRRSGIRRGGGHIFARRPRDYSYRLPRKALRMATRMAVASRLQDNEVTLVDELTFPTPATREMAGVLKALGLQGTTTLIATEKHDLNAYKSARNLQGVTLAPVSELNALLVLSPRRMLLTRGALDVLRAGANGTPAADQASPAVPAGDTPAAAAESENPAAAGAIESADAGRVTTEGGDADRVRPGSGDAAGHPPSDT